MRVANLVSGGVDSSVALFKIKEIGYHPTAFYLKIWMEEDIRSCPWQEDLKFVKAICRKLDIPLEIVSMQKEYWSQIIKYTLESVKKGETPNPDVFCNNFIKFGLFDEKYGKEFDKIATGHYARTKEQENLKTKKQEFFLQKAVDPAKDQVYFLSQLTSKQLTRCVFPVGDLRKEEVRRIAKNQGLITYNRPDSQGLCFLGKINFHDFLKRYIGVKKGKIIDWDTKKIVGEHEGFWFYTIGQREGLRIGGSSIPYYVMEKDSAENIIYVAQGQNNPLLWKKEVTLRDLNVLARNIWQSKNEFIGQLRYHSQEVKVVVMKKSRGKENIVKLQLAEQVFGIALGQIGVLYDQDVVIASGIIS